MNIDWTRVAKPQSNGYDVEVLSRIAYDNYGWKKLPKFPSNFLTLGEGSILVRASRENMSMGEAADVGREVTREWATEQNGYLSQWSAGYSSLSNYLDEFWPWRAPGIMGKGCSSGHLPPSVTKPFHAVFVTINDLQGCAQGIYHEFAHLRLRTLGIHMETHTGLLLRNADTELYDSPVRFDVKRPMPAVLQGLYAWLMFIENDYQLYVSGKSTGMDLMDYTLHNLPKIANGVREVSTYIKTTSAGREFWYGMETWANDLLDRCHAAAATILPREEYLRRCSTVRV